MSCDWQCTVSSEPSRRGGARPGAGRPAIVSLRQRLLIGRACEKDWQQWVELYDGWRPYGHRERILDKHTEKASDFFGKTVSKRFVESCWTQYRKFAATGDELPPFD